MRTIRFLLTIANAKKGTPFWSISVNHTQMRSLLAMVLASWSAWAGTGFPADGLHILVTIDGSDELHISKRSATWVHKSWQQPTDVRLNGFQWNPQQRPVL